MGRWGMGLWKRNCGTPIMAEFVRNARAIRAYPYTNSIASRQIGDPPSGVSEASDAPERPAGGRFWEMGASSWRGVSEGVRRGSRLRSFEAAPFSRVALGKGIGANGQILGGRR